LTQFVYQATGEAQAFIIGKFIYDLTGAAVGRVSGTRLYRLDGSYVGELFRDMAVQKPVTRRPSLQAIEAPVRIAPPTRPIQRSPILCEYPDAFHLFAADEEAQEQAPDPPKAPPAERRDANQPWLWPEDDNPL
jgi:hypothetical protein